MGIPTRTLPLALLLLACGGSGYDISDSGTSTTGDDKFGGTGTGGNTGTGTGGGEIEDDFLALPPAQTDLYVFIANPARNTISRVNTLTLEVITTPVGADPQHVVVTPDKAQVVVFNRADDSVSILDAESLGQTVVPVRDDMNQLKLAPDSRHGVLWYDLGAVQPGDPPADGLQSFNEASFVNLSTGVHSAMAVGFNPRDVVFTPEGELAAIVSDASLALVDLTASPLVPQVISLSAALEPPEAEEVVLGSAGDFAFVRQFGTTEILVVDLVSHGITPLAVGTNPTDMDLSPDGKDVAVITRGSEQLWVFDALDPFAAPRVISLPAGGDYGALHWYPESDKALLYTTASPVNRYAVWDTATDQITEHGLVKPVAGVAINPTGTGAMIFHTLQDAPDTPVGDPFFGQNALTLVDLTDHQHNPLLLPAAPISYALSEDGRFATFAMDGERYLETLDFQTLLHTQIPLKSDPVYVGVMPDPDPEDTDQPIAWVSQEHDLGRISFFEPDDGSLETITGFELNSGIE